MISLPLQGAAASVTLCFAGETPETTEYQQRKRKTFRVGNESMSGGILMPGVGVTGKKLKHSCTMGHERQALSHVPPPQL